MSFIYLDNNATTALDPIVLDEMLPYLTSEYGNASSTQHRGGRKAHAAIEQARIRIAQALHVKEKEIFFNSGSTEAINTVLKGVFDLYQSKGKHIITARTEHKAVLACCAYLEKKGAQITYLESDRNGRMDLTALEHAIRPDTVLVALMAANNETGVIHPIQQIAEITTAKDTLFFCDATQYVGKEYLNLQQVAIDILCLSAHKFHGPKGIGALFIRRKTKPIQVQSLIHGGKQEASFRGGTYNVPAIVGLGKAIEIADLQLDTQSVVAGLRDELERQILSAIPLTAVHAHQTRRLSNTSNIIFKHTKATEIMSRLKDLALSAGSACVSGDRDPSHVLKAMGMSDDEAYCSIRFSLSRYTTMEEISKTVSLLVDAVSNIRAQSPIWQLYQQGLID